MAGNGNLPPPIPTGLRGRCPRCGRGRLFSGFLDVARVCEVCGLDLKKEDSGDGPAVFVTFIVGAIVVPLALIVETSVEPPLWVHMLLWAPLALGGSLALLRPFKGVLIALQYRHRAGDTGTDTFDGDS